MPTNAYFSRPLALGGLSVPTGTKRVMIASLSLLPAGSYVLLAKVIVLTRVDNTGSDSAMADFSLEAGGLRDTASCALWHSSDPGALQPADTVSLQLAATVLGPAKRRASAVKLYCTSFRGALELKDLVITAVRVDAITDIT